MNLKKNLQIFQSICEDLDKYLQELNSDYKSKRFKNITMKRLEIIVAKEKLFFEWLKFKNKLGGQNKIPRLCNDRMLVEELIKLDLRSCFQNT